MGVEYGLTRPVDPVRVILRPVARVYIRHDTDDRAGFARIWGGVPCHPRTMLGGLDPVALDCAVLDVLREHEPRLASVRPEQVMHIGRAAELGLGQLEAELSPL